MRKLAIAVALASTALATPAVARDHSFYAGLEGGVMWVEDMDLDFNSTAFTRNDAITITHNSGFDVDVIAGYDFGAVRVEGELGYKRAGINQAIIDPFIAGGGAGDNYDASGRGRATSAMINGLIDYGNEDGLSGYAGVGVGLASVKYNPEAVTPNGIIGFSDTYSGLAWQGIIGLRYAISPNLDLGLKYRYFNVPNVKFNGDDGVDDFSLKGKWRSHSLLASLIYNFWAPPPPPPPPPPPAPERG